MATLAAFRPPVIQNEPNKHYAQGSPDREKLQSALKAFKSKAPLQVPLMIGGKAVTTSSVEAQHNPSDHAQVVAKYHNATQEDVKAAIASALEAKKSWESLPFADRAAVFLKAADLVGGKYRYEIMAATMLGQGKNAWQAEIDAAAELCDFFSRVEYRPLEGFVYAISPFNFTAIGGNLPAAPALMGNTVVWKPSPYAIAANYLIYSILVEAGLPPGVIQFVPGDAELVTRTILDHPEFAGLHFTGSTAVFRSLYGKIAQGVAEGKYKGYPRIVGETGGKNFHVVHHSADIPNAVLNTIRGAFEFQGQKCSACSRTYVPASKWDEFRTGLVAEVEKLKIGGPEDFTNFIGPVIHEHSFAKLSKVIDDAKSDKSLTLLAGGKYDKSKGYFIHPTIYSTTDVKHHLLSTELFGPVLVVVVYDDAAPNAFESICKTIDSTGQYGLTGAVFAREREAIYYAENALRSTAGNFYINCKCTGAVVGQQPFGGARASGTNDKAGSQALLSRFVSMRSIKEEFVAIEKVLYPSNE
ncbi:1-pyrroline-5-carboxylate dehydrogenase [Emydomyces testavorans]|uniref:L-glutamate gamma-semialdehyde dehydrogenase n=1 Tax=Emydomyces testavorans TaxID=2070801 RepID=A0AAF0DCM9_9EURO|nr:1-pyrroline-5-carboxylate dehydrogenase [Emydomyces testavorans]